MLCTSGFVDDVTFSHTTANIQNQRRRDAYVSSSSPGGSTAGDVCHLRLQLVILNAGTSFGFAILIARFL